MKSHIFPEIKEFSGRKVSFGSIFFPILLKIRFFPRFLIKDDDFYQSQAESQKRKLDTIHEYLLYIMSPFVYEEDMDEFCTDLLRFAMDHNYRPEVEWKRYKNKLSSFDVRHLVWSIAIRLGLGKGKVYSNDDCACYIERRFASLCVTASGEPLSHSTLRNLIVTSNSDQIHCDIQGADGLLFHIPSQLGSSC